jgi:ribosomal protein S27AE
MTIEILSARARQRARMASVEAVVFRACPSCGLGNPPRDTSGERRYGARHWRSCPRCGSAGTAEHFGIVAFWHRNPLRRLFWRASRWLRAGS